MITTRRIAPSVYEAIVGGHCFEIDGQNGIEYGGNEWQVFHVEQGAYAEERTWCETYPTKRVAISDLQRLADQCFT